MTAILFSPRIGPIQIDCWITEKHSSSIGITEIPVESGAKITDHSYVEPKKLDIDFANEQAAISYQALVRFQESRSPFTIVSGLTVYTNMLIREIGAERDAETHGILKGTASLQEIIIVHSASAPATDKGGGQPGGKLSTKAAAPTKTNTIGQATSDRASGTVTRGDQPSTTTVPPVTRQQLREVVSA